jgi:glycosyltransferase involved in cell wall biosynthesis
MSDDLLISIILLTYNQSKYLEQALNGLASQTEKRFQVIFADDTSTDNTRELIDRFIRAELPFPYKLFYAESNMGQALLMNEATKIADTPFVTWLAADDIWMPECLSKLLSALQNIPHAGIAYGFLETINDRGERVKDDRDKNLFRSGTGLFLDLFNRNFVNACAVLARRSAWEVTGGYDAIRMCEDYGLWLKISILYEFVCVPEILVQYRIHTESITYKIFRDSNQKAQLDIAVARLRAIEFLLKYRQMRSIKYSDRYHLSKAISRIGRLAISVKREDIARPCLRSAFKLNPIEPRLLYLLINMYFSRYMNSFRD